MKILLVHPEGNINNNPNLLAIAETLAENGFQIDYLAQLHHHVYQQNRQFCKIYLLKSFSIIKKLFSREGFACFIMRVFSGLVCKRYSLIIGVDMDGIIVANFLSENSKVPLAYISYEIFFEEELPSGGKEEERFACRNIRFAICQDHLRAEKLSTENNIPVEKILYVPVAGRGVPEVNQYSGDLRSELHIPSDKKIALYMGSIEAWSGICKILNDLKNWPDNWVLLIHGRYEGEEQYAFLKSLKEDDRKKIYISAKAYSDFTELYRLPLFADIGLAIYLPDWSTPYHGNNLKYLGWSSGKVSTYLQCGLPVIVNDIGLISESVAANSIGYVLHDGLEVSDVLKSINSEEERNKKKYCRDFFLKNLDMNIHKEKILRAVSTKCEKPSKSIFYAPLSLLVLFLDVVFETYKFFSKVKQGLNL